jgi:UDP:flavonoid glycosyltransferase YjiC (YdhE family)
MTDKALKKQAAQNIHVTGINLNNKELKHRIYFSINGEGYGHSSRCLAIAKQLGKDEAVLGSYGYVLNRLKDTQYRTVEISPEISFVGKDGNFDIGLTILKNSSWPVAINQIIREEKKIMQNYGITCVVSDSRTAPVFAANKLGLPCILLTNQTTFAPFFDVEINNLEGSLIEKPFREWLRAGTKAVITNAAEPFVLKVVKDWLKATDEIFIPDLSPPYSVGLPLYYNENFVKKKQRFIGPLLPWSWKSVLDGDHREFLPSQYCNFQKRVVCTLGGHKYRKPLFDAVINLAKQMPGVLFIVLGNFTSDVKLSNLFLVGFVDNPADYYLNADLIITQAGHSTAMELITLGLPMLVVPDTYQVEQESNAKRLCELGIATKLSYKELNSGALFDQVQHMIEEPAYAASAKEISKLARNYIAEEEAANIIRDYSARIQAY